MEDLLANLALGFSVALTPQNIVFCLIGALLGTLIGVLPGIGPIATIAMLLPITFQLAPVSALIMLAGIYYGAQYGGSTTAILVNMPGEASSVVTAIDGYQMARQGRAGVALSISALGSFFAGTVGTVLIAALGVPLTRLAQAFGPPEYFALMIMGLVAAIVMASGSLMKAVAMIFVGLLLSTVGTDLETGEERMTFGIPELSDGIEFTQIAMGLFGIAEILRNLDRPENRELLASKIKGLFPRWADIKAAFPAALRGTAIGSVLGILPGNGAVLGAFASYSLEKKIARDPSRFGKGAIEGVAGPESANNAGAQTSFIPLLTLGIPPNAVMALMVGAMTIHNITPGPLVIQRQPDLFWGMIASMWVGNLLLVIINLPLIGIWVRLLRVPYRMLFPAILLFCCIGIYSINAAPFEVFLIAFFGLVGYALFKFGFEPAPLLLSFVLGKLMEEKLRQSLLLSGGDWSVFATRPISGGLLLVSAIMLAIVLTPAIRRGREKAFTE